ncbi:hypothetical protein [Phaeobacter inhibens]|uniref:hypothetical protein n=1 Tax=Phaeobacter inhibens TaxID=221822 RepID=UPI0021A4BC61|nr:hypothetical protein [Phaeobacter inhibens]UWR55517.1 hypothetical protein K4F89_10615 [Phaeobacter inhibens]
MINLSNDLLIVRLPSRSQVQATLERVEDSILAPDRAQVSRSQASKERLFEKFRDAVLKYNDTKKVLEDAFLMGLGDDQTESKLSLWTSFHNYKKGSGYHSRLRGFARNLLFQLWCEKRLILPYRFNFQRSVTARARVSSTSEVAKFLTEYEADQDAQAKHGLLIQKRMNSHCWVWLHTTNWVNFSDISLDDAELLCREIARRVRSESETNSPSSVGAFLSVAKENFPSEVNYSAEDWLAISAEIQAEGLKSGAANRAKMGLQLEENAILRQLIDTPREDGFFVTNKDLNGTKYQLSDTDLSRWEKLFSEYLEHRQSVKGYEDLKGISVSLRKLSSYIGYYLPSVLAEKNAPSKYAIRAPKEFRRKLHVVGDVDGLSVPTFLTFLKEFSPVNATRRVWIGHAEHFFEWLAANYSEPEFREFAGPDFINPFNRKFDLQKLKKVYVTNKKPFSRATLPHLLLWLYEIEKFGIFLQKKERSGEISFEKIRTNPNVDHFVHCRDFGRSLQYDYLEERFRIFEAPLHLFRGGNTSGPIWLSQLRWHIFTLETGLRHQATQWLDRRTWDLQAGQDNGLSVKQLWVNTDKTHDAFQIPILKRVYDLLLRQQEQEDLSGNPHVDVPYENREYSRFPDVQHLFRSPRGAYIGDSDYHRYWGQLLYAFQGFICRAGLKLPPVVRFTKPEGGVPKTKQDIHSKSPLCVIPLKSEHTPHSCRVSFISHRSPFVDLGSIAKQVGHNSSVATAHYCYPDFAELSAKLEESDILYEQQNRNPTISSGPAFIKASEQNSRLRRSFENDRQKAISEFGIVNLSSIHDKGESGIDILRASRASEIVFRDTHICPIGEDCPQEVIEDGGEAMRCGACRFACKSVDHLPAIEAKRNSLLARIQASVGLLRIVNKDQDRSVERQQIHRKIELDTRELLGWTHTAENLRGFLAEKAPEGSFFTNEPEIVRNHLRRVVRKSSQQEFLLQRILEADYFPALASDELRLKSSRLFRKLLSSSFPQDMVGDDDPDFEIKTIASAIYLRLKAGNIELADIASEIENKGDLSLIPPNQTRS